ncbi:Uncharacterised protein [Vibrio cholerae]|nr:Uncharacterised protein [Vibrio cholerae]
MSVISIPWIYARKLCILPQIAVKTNWNLWQFSVSDFCASSIQVVNKF